MTTGRDIRFWRNVVLIALAHVALVVGLIRWSVAARASTNAESIVWLGGAEDLAAGQSENEKAPSLQREAHPDQPKPLRDDQAEEEKPVVTPAHSEIELPSPTPKLTPKTTPKPTPKKILLAKASPKPLPKTKPSPAKSSEKSEKNEKSLAAKTGTASQNRSGKAGSTTKSGSAHWMI